MTNGFYSITIKGVTYDLTGFFELVKLLGSMTGITGAALLIFFRKKFLNSQVEAKLDSALAEIVPPSNSPNKTGELPPTKNIANGGTTVDPHAETEKLG